MKRYLKKLKTFIQMGKLLESLSVCKRLQVGAIIFPTDCSAIYSIGYNGPSKHLPNDSCSGVPGNCGCIHAELNAVIKFNNDFAKPSLLYTTKSPCEACARVILNCSSIVGVIWSEEYRSLDGVNLLKEHKLDIIDELNLRIETQTVLLRHWKSLC